MKNGNNKSKAYFVQKKLRNTWDMNPVTRIKEDERRDRKKRRRENNKEIKGFSTDGSD